MHGRTIEIGSSFSSVCSFGREPKEEEEEEEKK